MGELGHIITGSLTTNVVPFPFSLVLSIVPLCASMMRWQMAKPRPVPLPFVVKNGSKTRFRFSSGIPLPVSETHILTQVATYNLMFKFFQPVQLGNHHKGTEIRRNLREGYSVVIAQVEFF